MIWSIVDLYIIVDYFILYLPFQKGFLYYSLGNLHPKLRSSLKSIHLLSVAKQEYITKYGIEKMLQPGCGSRYLKAWKGTWQLLFGYKSLNKINLNSLRLLQ